MLLDPTGKCYIKNQDQNNQKSAPLYSESLKIKMWMNSALTFWSRNDLSEILDHLKKKSFYSKLEKIIFSLVILKPKTQYFYLWVTKEDTL